MTTIAAPVQMLLEVFNQELVDVRFGDLDVATLNRLATGVQAAETALLTAQITLDAARAALSEQQDLLTQHAQRALAYARVYAETNEPLSRKLDGIVLPRAPKRPRPEHEDRVLSSSEPEAGGNNKKRGRRKAVVASSEPVLPGAFHEDDSTSAAASA